MSGSYEYPGQDASTFEVNGKDGQIQDFYLQVTFGVTVRTPAGQIVEWFTIITTDPNELTADFYGRMPWTAPGEELSCG